jgi:hypothetical protein
VESPSEGQAAMADPDNSADSLPAVTRHGFLAIGAMKEACAEIWTPS